MASTKSFHQTTICSMIQVPRFLTKKMKTVVRDAGSCIKCEVLGPLPPKPGRGSSSEAREEWKCACREREEACCFFNARTFIFSADGELQDVQLTDSSPSRVPCWNSDGPSDMTSEMVTENLWAASKILIPELVMHQTLRQAARSTVKRPLALDGLRSVCDVCGASILCSGYICALCGEEICSACKLENQEAICSGDKPHWLVFVDVFLPGELESALEILKKAEPLERPTNFPQHDGPGPVRFSLASGSGEPTYSQLYSAFASGVPVVISGLNRGEGGLTPEYLIENFGDEEVSVIDTKTEEHSVQLFKDFLATFHDPERQNPPLKIKDWPPGMHFRQKYPGIYRFFQMRLTAPDITSSEGSLNLESHMPEGSNPPDTGPKGYLAHGSAGGVSTALHCDMTDAINHCFYAGESHSANSGALWTTIHRDDMELATDWLRREKRGQFTGHPIHAQRIHLVEEDVHRLSASGIRIVTFLQRQGESVVIPAGVPHQVKNITPCIKIAKDFVVPCDVEHSARMGRQLRLHRLERQDEEAEDVLALTTMCWWFFRRSQTRELLAAPSDPDSNPWTSKISAAPLCIHARTATKAASADVFPSVQPGSDEPTWTGSEFDPYAGSEIGGIPFEDPSLSAPPRLTEGISSTYAHIIQPVHSQSKSLNTRQRRKTAARRQRDTLRSKASRVRAKIARSSGSFTCPFYERTGQRCSQQGRPYQTRRALLQHVIDAHGAYVDFLNNGQSHLATLDIRHDLENMAVLNDDEWLQVIVQHMSPQSLR